MMDVKRGDILMVNLPKNDFSVQSGTRPVLVLQNNIGNKYSPTTIVVPLTSQIKKVNQPTHKVISKEDATGLKVDSMVLCEQIITIDKRKIEEKIGQITNDIIMKSISKACSVSLGII